jgi:hypothetical protein
LAYYGSRREKERRWRRREEGLRKRVWVIKTNKGKSIALSSLLLLSPWKVSWLLDKGAENKGWECECQVENKGHEIKINRVKSGYQNSPCTRTLSLSLLSGGEWGVGVVGENKRVSGWVETSLLIGAGNQIS